MHIGRPLLFPYPAVVALLVPIAAVGLICAFAVLDEGDIRRVALFALSFYALLVLCMRAPAIWTFVGRFRRENRFYLRYSSDIRLKMRLSLNGAFLYNALYALFLLALGLRHHSAWFYAMAGYYFLLALMRLMLGRHLRASVPGKDLRGEWCKYRLCGAGLVPMNLALSVFVFYYVRHLRPTTHHEITVIAMAAYTFLSLTMAIVNIVRYRRYASPVCSAAKALSLASACISMLSLENAMLTAFSAADETLFRQIMLGASGAVAAMVILGIALYMIVHATKNLRCLCAGRP